MTDSCGASSVPILDLAIVAGFVGLCLALGAWSGRRSAGTRDYFLAERGVPAWAVMVSIVATETSAVTFLSVPGLGYREDLRFLQLAFGYALARIAVAAFLLPAYFRGKVQTAYEVLARRFGGRVQTAASVVFLIARTLGSGLRLFLAAGVLQAVTGWGMPAMIASIGLATLLYTALGGLKGVIWADVFQFFVYLAAAIVAVVLLQRLVTGGWAEILRESAQHGWLRVFDFSWDLTRRYTFWSGLIGGFVLDAGTHGADHMMVQRYLAARSQRQAAWALIASGLVIVAQFTLFLGIGLGMRVYQAERIFHPVVAWPKDREFATFILAAFPSGLLGLVIAAIVSVTMSTVSGAISASASSTVDDLVRPRFPSMSDSAALRLSRVVTIFWGLAQMGVAFAAVGMTGAVVDQALSVASFVTGILLGVFVLGLVSERVGPDAALVGMASGFVGVSAVAFGTRVAYPWWSLVGSSLVVLFGLASGPFFAGKRMREGEL